MRLDVSRYRALNGRDGITTNIRASMSDVDGMQARYSIFALQCAQWYFER